MASSSSSTTTKQRSSGRNVKLLTTKNHHNQQQKDLKSTIYHNPWCLFVLVGTLVNIATTLVISNLFASMPLTHDEHHKVDLNTVMDSGRLLPTNSNFQEQQQQGEIGVCESWPLSELGLPLGATHLEVDDGSASKCNGMNSLLTKTLQLSFPKQDVNHVTIGKRHRATSCRDFVPSTIFSSSRLSPRNPSQKFIKRCLKGLIHDDQPTTTRRTTNNNLQNHNNNTEKTTTPMNNQTNNTPPPPLKKKTPIVVFPVYPPHSKHATHSPLLTRDGLAELTKNHICRQSIDTHEECIMPPTYRISENEMDCNEFFSVAGGSKVPWLKKKIVASSTPSNHNNNNHHNNNNNEENFGGKTKSIELVENFHEELAVPYDLCHIAVNNNNNENNNNKKHSLAKSFAEPPPNIVVQKYIAPHLIQGRSFHIRTYFLYKLGSKKREGRMTDDPPQAWFISVGNIHVCSEPYQLFFSTEPGDEERKPFAYQCGTQMWDQNPRTANMKTMDEEGEEGGDEQKGGIHERTQPFPRSLHRFLSKEEYKSVMEKLSTLFETLAILITQYNEEEAHIFDADGESSWLHFGVDLLLDKTLRPWLLNLNHCPMSPLFGSKKSDVTRNPYISMMRLIMTHYRRHHLNDLRFHEKACSSAQGLRGLIHRVL